MRAIAREGRVRPFRRLPMIRHWSRAIVSVGLLSVPLVVACGGDSSDTETLTSKDAGQKDSTSLSGDDVGTGGNQSDATMGDDTNADASLDDGGADGANDEAGDATGASGDDGGA